MTPQNKEYYVIVCASLFLSQQVELHRRIQHVVYFLLAALELQGCSALDVAA